MQKTNKKDILQETGLTADEYDRIKKLLNRDPNHLEWALFGVMWSEHCSYKHSTSKLKTLPTTGPQVLQGPGENAGIVEIGDGKAIAFKIESHNHPSAIEPYQGAATGVGGIVRDVLTMGARPIALLNSLRFGNFDSDHVQYLFDGVVSGIAGYGNCLGLPTVGGEIDFTERYRDNPLVNVMCIGLLDADDIKTGTATGVGNPVMVVGAPTGRDGIQGASFASDELTEDAEEDRPAVQVGDPFREKLLVEAVLEFIHSDAVVGIQDMGAAGLAGAASEMAARGDTGMEIDVSKIPLREEGMTPYEIMLSESQERMLVVCEKGKEKELRERTEKWDLPAATIGQVTGDGTLHIHDGKETRAQLPARTLVDEAPEYQPESSKPSYIDDLTKIDTDHLDEPTDYEETFLNVLTAPDTASKEWVYRQFDHMVRTNTVVRPGSDAAVLRIKGTDRAIAATTDCNSRYCYLDPRSGTRSAVAEAARNLTCIGAEPLALTDGLNFGNPEKPEVYWQFSEAMKGMKEACEALETPVIGGNVSFYNESESHAIYPTPIIGMIGQISDLDHVTTVSFEQPGDTIILLGETHLDLGGSRYLYNRTGTIDGHPPSIDLNREQEIQQCCRRLIRNGYVQSAHDCSKGGLIVTLAESCMPEELGIQVDVDPDMRLDHYLFSETPSRIVISVPEDQKSAVQEEIEVFDLPYTVLGNVQSDRFAINGVIDLSVEKMHSNWSNAIEKERET